MWKRAKFSENEGFTLLEVLIAVAIMAVAFSAILGISSSSIRSVDKSRTMNVVHMLAKRAMVDAELNMEGRSFTEVKSEETGHFENPYEEYGWKREVKEIEFPNLIGSGGSSDGEGGSRAIEMMGKLIAKYLSRSMREVVVTVSWPQGKGVQTFSISTYWIHLGQEFSLSE